MSKLFSGIVIAAVLAVGYTFLAPQAVEWYQTRQAAVQVKAADTAYTSALADAQVRLKAELNAAHEHFTTATQTARSAHDATLTQISATYPHAKLPRTVAVSDIQ